MKRRFKGLAIAAGIALMTTISAPLAHAALTIEIVGDGSCTDGAACDMNGGVNGRISWTTSAGTFFIDGSTTTSATPIAALTLSGTLAAGTAPSSITFRISDTGFSNPTPPLILTQNANANAIAGASGPTGTINAQGYFSQTNTLFDT